MRFGTVSVVAALAAMVGIFAFGLSNPPQPQDIPSVSVIDGDTIEVGGRVFRLAGIDAPELGQVCDEGGHLTACGRDAAYALRKLIELENHPPACIEVDGTETFACRAGPVDLAAAMLARGAVTALPDAPAHLRVMEERARAIPLGIWRGGFVPPADWRTGERLPAERHAVQAASSETDWPWRVAGVQVLPVPITHRNPCVFKAVDLAGSARGYFGPLDEDYESIDLETGNGRLFCSDDEARQAGWLHGHIALNQVAVSRR